MAGRFALIIAVEHYDDPRLLRLKPPVDVRALQAVLEAPEIGGFDEVTTLVDEASAAVRDAIVRFFDRARSDDVLLLYFSGHSATDEEGQRFLALRDTQIARLAETAIASAFLRQQMDKVLSSSLILVLDCADKIAHAFEGPGRRVILTSNEAAQTATEGSRVSGHVPSSMFTHFLIEGLRTGAADRNADGDITVAELFDYLYDRMATVTPSQTPGKWTRGRPGDIGDVDDIVVAQNPFVRVRREEEARRAAETARAEGEIAVRKEIEPQRSVDENVQFTVYRPPVVVPERWYPMLAFAHLSARRPDAAPNEPDPIAEMERQAQQILGADADVFAHMTQDSRLGIPRDGHLRIVPAVPGIEFNPRERSFLWTEPVHREAFRLRARRDADGRTVRGTVSVFLDCVLVADVTIAIAVKSGAEQKPVPIQDVARPYRRIFASYSHRDAAVVAQFQHYAQGFGDRYMRDVIDLRAGEVWNRRLAEMIEEADVFQLFWSWNSIGSPFVRSEWEHALKMNRAYFIRPVYWETPFPERADLPPAALKALHFAHVGTLIEPPPAPAAPAPRAPAPRPPVAPAAQAPPPPPILEDAGTFTDPEATGTFRAPPAKSSMSIVIVAALVAAIAAALVVAKACFSL